MEKSLYSSGQAHLVSEEAPCLTRFLAGSFNMMIYNYRYLIVCVFFIYGVISVVIACQMGPLSKGEEMMSSDHPLVET